jgi:DNA-binding MarR family transcriptional regulator
MPLRVGYELKRAQYTLRLATDEVARRHDLTTPQYAVLDALGRKPGASGAALARMCFVTPQSMNELLVRLERSGLVERASDPSHGRRLSLTLTPAGASVLSAITVEMEGVQQRMVSALTTQEAKALSSYLRSCADALENWLPRTDANRPVQPTGEAVADRLSR